MSRLNDLIRQLRLKDPALADDLEREVSALADRRAFGLNFERHTPEAVELAGRRVRRGDKVRRLPPRGTMPRQSDEMLWRVAAITHVADRGTARLEALGDEEQTTSAALDDLVVVAAFREPIYPGLVSTGRVERGEGMPFHTVINAENYHALQTLLFTHRGKVDCIYLDPPYNTGAKDWKYNNHYVESDDLYRHSKWLAFMERRLLLAKELLNPTSSTLIVTIDEKELHRLGLLLEQVFEGANCQMVTSVISAKGAVRPGQFSRVEEHLFVVTLGAADLKPWDRNMLDEPKSYGENSDVDWLGLRRREPSSVRGARPNQFYPIFVEADTGRLHSVGDPIQDGIPRDTVSAPRGSVVVWPLKPNGLEMLWGLTPDVLRRNWKRGYARVNRWNATTARGTIQYLPGGTISRIESGEIQVVGRAADGSVVCVRGGGPTRTPPKRVWNMSSHNAELGGTNVLSSMMPDRRFPYPKSLYAVEDVLRFFVGDLVHATVLDFFSGSGTTAHAVMRLNKQDGGQRQSICITNNEVAADEQRQLRKNGLRPGDSGWEKWGICEYITKPRIQASIEGVTPDGEPIKGDYKFTHEFPMSDGFEENVEFFTLTYEAPLRVASNREFERVAPLLWLRAGSRGRRIDDISKGWDVADAYGVIADFDHTDDFVQALADHSDAVIVFVVTDEDWLFESMCRKLPEHVEPIRLYEAYLRNFELESGEGRPMKFTLKDYQQDAVGDVLHLLEQARTIFHRDGRESSFSLSATTGAGKTVMAAAAIEALFYGSGTFEFEPDSGAVVIWFSDDPNLNDQTRSRLMEASEKLVSSDLVTVAPPFSKPRLDPGKVYFLNTGKLTRNSLLTRGHDPDPDAEMLPGLDAAVQPDMQGWTIWETIANTIDDDDLTVYLILDEAHRGFNTRTTSDKPTIVRRLVNGHAGYPPIPVVWGISATIERFREAMEAADADKSRRALPPVLVDPNRVQESGLVKDTVLLEIPAEAGNFDTVLVRRGARKLRESTERWQSYAQAQGSIDVVRPLLVLQSPNTPDPDTLGRALDEIFAEYPDLRDDAVRHVLGDHSVQRFGTWEVDWIEPRRVEEMTRVRVLIAKDGISTGWDCPRAEVLVSFRPAKDHTHITQLLGRMVRNPLARRVPGDERLNAVDCILPFFDRTTAGSVVKFLTGQLEEMPAGSGKKVLLDGRQLGPNPQIPESVWECWDALPTLTVPQRGARPVKRAVALAERLSGDGVRPGALKEVEEEMHTILDTYATRYAKQLEKAVFEVWAVRGQSIAGTVGASQLGYSDFVERADDRAIRVAFDAARKAFGADIAQSYVNHVAGPDDDGADDDLRDAYVRTSALATVPDVRVKVDKEADDLVVSWFARHRVEIRGLPDEHQQQYEVIRALATEPQRGELTRPRSRMEDYSTVDDSGQEGVAPVVGKHLMSDEHGMFPIASLNDWERDVVIAELKRPDSVGWYRNPARAAVDSLGITYRDAVGNWRSMHPDFIFFNEVGGKVRASIVDPHGHHLEDSMLKLRGLARFAEEYGGGFYRIEAVTKIGTTMRILDLQIPAVREALIRGDATPFEYYKSDLAVEYNARK